MTGGVYRGRDGHWYYREKQWKDGEVQWDQVATCIETEGGE